MHIHILGIAGTFMGSLAQLAKALGHCVTGADLNVYPPMSTQLQQAGIEYTLGWDPAQLKPRPDLVVVGNVISRGNPVMEAVLAERLPYLSGPQWLGETLLRDRWVLAVAGTHGKTTTSSMLAWILDQAGYAPGFLIGGVPRNFGVSARLGSSDFFVIEADEYDTAFFDKRSKFVHYKPDTLVMNNLEFDHADIFPDLAAIERQFHHLVRTVPSTGLLIHPANDAALGRVLAQGAWTPTQTTGQGGDWQAQLLEADASAFCVQWQGQPVGEVHWDLSGQHNVANALSAIAAARHVGVEPHWACDALCRFESVKRRLEPLLSAVTLTGPKGPVTLWLYDDFAHHPTAIATTLAGLRARIGQAGLTAIIEPRSNTMKRGTHSDLLLSACAAADSVLWFQSADHGWSLAEAVAANPSHSVWHSLTTLASACLARLATQTGDQHWVLMSNGSFGGLGERLRNTLAESASLANAPLPTELHL